MSNRHQSNQKYYKLSVVAIISIIFATILVFIDNRSFSDTPPTPGSAFQLSSSQLVKLENQANMGNTEAMWSLYNYYSMWLGDDIKSAYWLNRAAEAGDQQAKDVIAELGREPIKPIESGRGK